MAFLVEDGSAVQGSNSLTSVEYFQSYCTDRGYSTQAGWEVSRTQVNLIKATDYLNQRYQTQFTGFPVSPCQGCCWPRDLAKRTVSDADDAWFIGWGIVPRSLQYLDSHTVPDDIQKAVCELALISDSADLSPIIRRDDINTIAKKIGPIEIDYSRKRIMAWDIFTKVSRLVGPYLTYNGGQATMVRG